MKFDVKKMLRSRDAWVVVGGAAAVVTAFAAISARGSSRAPSYGYPNDAGLGGGDSTDDPSKIDSRVLVAAGHDPVSSFTAFDSPQPVTRSSSAALPVTGLPSAPTYADAAGNPATLAQIFAQHFSGAPAPQPAPAAPAPATTYYTDRSGNRVTLDELLAQPFQAPVATATGPSYSVPAPTPLYVEPIYATNLKTPGGGLASPTGVETYMGGGGSPLSDHTTTALAA